MRPSQALSQHRDAICRAAARYRVANPRVFGSALHGDDQEGSDLDLLVDTLPGTTLFDLGGLQDELQELLGVSVDVLTLKDLPTKFRDIVAQEARPVWHKQVAGLSGPHATGHRRCAVVYRGHGPSRLRTRQTHPTSSGDEPHRIGRGGNQGNGSTPSLCRATPSNSMAQHARNAQPNCPRPLRHQPRSGLAHRPNSFACTQKPARRFAVHLTATPASTRFWAVPPAWKSWPC